MKIKKVLILLALVVALSLSFTACVKVEAPDKTGAETTTKQDPTPSPKPAPEPEPEPENDPVLENLAKETKSEIDALMAQFADIYSNIIVYVDGDAFVYAYTYLNPVPDIAASKEYFVSQEQSLKDATDPLVSSLKALGARNPSIRYEYFNPDGTLIYSYENA